MSQQIWLVPALAPNLVLHSEQPHVDKTDDHISRRRPHDVLKSLDHIKNRLQSTLRRPWSKSNPPERLPLHNLGNQFWIGLLISFWDCSVLSLFLSHWINIERYLFSEDLNLVADPVLDLVEASKISECNWLIILLHRSPFGTLTWHSLKIVEASKSSLKVKSNLLLVV